MDNIYIHEAVWKLKKHFMLLNMWTQKTLLIYISVNEMQ